MVAPYFRNIIIILVVNLIVQLGWAQQASIFSQVTVNKNNVYVGEAVEVTIGIYTSTWFTQGVDIGNISINGAFSVYFRSVSTVKKIKGKSYAGVQFIYHVFPFENQDIIIPSLNVQVETPKEGGYKGVKRQLKTKERTIKIKPYPPGIDKSTWMVTNSMTVNEQWLGNTKTIKVGDVLERKITRRANGTVSELLPPIIWDSIPNISLYPSQSALNTNKSKTAISASRTDGVRYLFEEEGEVIIPDMEFLWWSSYRKRFYKKTVKGLTVNVLPNPDLEMLKTVKAKLSSAAQEDNQEAESEEFLILGFTVKHFLIGVISISLILFILLKMLIKVVTLIKKNNKVYKQSEAYAFKRFKIAIRSQNRKTIIPQLYKWLDQLHLEEPTLNAVFLKSKNEKLLVEIKNIEEQLGKDDSSLIINYNLWAKVRKDLLQGNKNTTLINTWINP